MTEEKKKVRDLATELGMQPKEVLATAKTLGIISAKVAASTLSDVDYSRLRTQLTGGNDKRDEVKVRRRRKDEKNSSMGSPSSGEIKKKIVDDHKEVAEKKVKEPLPPVSIVSAPAAAGEDVRPVSNQAKIINLSGKSTLPSVSPIEQVSTTLSVEEVAVLAIPEVEKDTLLVENANNTEKEKISVAEKKEPARSVDSKKDQAKIIRPATFSAEPERTSLGKTISSVPGMNGKTGGKAEKTHQNTSVEEKATPSSNSSVRVISRPDPQQVAKPNPRQGQDRQNQPARQGQDRQNQPARQGQDRQGGNKQGQQNRAGSGRPGGGNNFSRGESSAPQQDRNLRTIVPLDQAQEDSRKKRQKGRRTVDFASGGMDRRRDEDAGWSKASNRKSKNRKQREAPPVGGTQPVKAIKRKIKVEEFIRVSDLAHQMGLKSSEIIKALFALGVMATINQTLDIETATLVAIEFGYEIEKVGFSEKDFLDTQHAEESPGSLLPRPPVVTIMGHVDHGKTSLLDAIRKSSVVTGEAGGITQHIGAYHVKTKKGEIVFLDTPGHEAFTAMRARGAEVTDIVVLVVAADDGVMEQTKEAINHAKAANVPIMVAVNKIDKPGAEPDRVKRELADFGLVPEEWGGETVFSYVSAKQGDGLDDLLELLALQAEVLELKANPNRLAVGHIVEAKLDKGRGALGTVLIQQGTLRLGDSFVCGTHSGRVRAMFDDQGKKVKEATPSMPVEVQGFEGVPEAGEEFICIADEKTARRIADSRAMKQRERELARESKITLETFLASRVGDVEAAVLNLVVKADVRGSLEAIIDAMTKLSTEKVRINVIHGGTGAVSESDVLLAAASNAIIIGFNVRPSAKAKDLAQQEKVDIRFYDIIYKLVEEIRSAMEGMLAPVSKEVILGTADVREVFSVPKVGTVAGSHVSDGKIVRGCNTRLLRDGVVVHTGKLGSLRRFKDDVKEVTKGYECGISIEGFNDIKAGDAIEAFEIVEEAATL